MGYPRAIIETNEGPVTVELWDDVAPNHVKNFLDLPKIKIPLILGIWGGKGQGKSFQCELAYKRMGIDPIMMSAGELESGNAGEPAKLVRQRYREAADIITKGKMCSLYINDLDAVEAEISKPMGLVVGSRAHLQEDESLSLIHI